MGQKNNQKEQHLGLYLETLKKTKIDPNFFISREYFEKAGITEEQNHSGIHAFDDKKFDLFPPLRTDIKWPYMPMKGVRADFPNWPNVYRVCGPISKFLDYEFIFDQRNFLDLSGNKWKTFRKNIKKWPKGKLYTWVNLNDPCCNYVTKRMSDDINELFLKWLQNKNSEEVIYDPETLTIYLDKGFNRYGLCCNNELKAIVIWDYNWKYINFRYCICAPEPFLSEYVQYCFYTFPFIQNDPRLINDGGCLDSESLYFFKKRMNPVEIKKIHSWE